MVQLVKRKRLDILVDSPLANWLASEAEKVGIPHHTFLPVSSGRGRTGSWRDEDVSGALAKKMFVAVAKEEQVSALVDALAPHLDAYGLVVVISDVEVVRSERF
jgi:nitrogen regulatory protein PII